MRRTGPVIAAITASFALLGGCGAVKATASAGHPAEKLTTVGPGLIEVALTEEVAKNIGVTSAPVVAGESGLLIPTSAIIYRPDGTSWVYTVVRPNTFVRAAITVADDTGEATLLSSGPPAGTLVVSRGVSLIYGTEFKIGK